MKDWFDLHGREVSPLAAGILEAMDRQFLETLLEEIALNQAKRSVI